MSPVIYIYIYTYFIRQQLFPNDNVFVLVRDSTIFLACSNNKRTMKLSKPVRISFRPTALYLYFLTVTFPA